MKLFGVKTPNKRLFIHPWTGNQISLMMLHCIALVIKHDNKHWNPFPWLAVSHTFFPAAISWLPVQLWLVQHEKFFLDRSLTETFHIFQSFLLVLAAVLTKCCQSFWQRHWNSLIFSKCLSSLFCFVFLSFHSNINILTFLRLNFTVQMDCYREKLCKKCNCQEMPIRWFFRKIWGDRESVGAEVQSIFIIQSVGKNVLQIFFWTNVSRKCFRERNSGKISTQIFSRKLWGGAKIVGALGATSDRISIRKNVAELPMTSILQDWFQYHHQPFNIILLKIIRMIWTLERKHWTALLLNDDDDVEM